MSYQEDGETVDGLGDMFTEPEVPPSPKATFVNYDRKPERLNDSEHDTRSRSWQTVVIRLVGSHPLWGHYLWNAAKSFATYLDVHSNSLCKGKAVLELGAGGGLPGLVCALNGAKQVMLTDYPDHSLIENLKYNVEVNVSSEHQHAVRVMGYLWGKPVEPLLVTIDETDGVERKFDLIILSDLIFNHSQHDALLDTCDEALSADACNVSTPSEPGTPCVLVFYSHHRPRYVEKDLEFFRKARDRGWLCEKIVEERMEVMFPEDSGDENIRGTVYGWRLSRNPI
ncbi:nicotinamide n-methyltransferase [Tulasnella sp. 418]|nr:nicotinamide n-methyltransferase [Tulasnella sp. 418]